jgi:hypothetical protein
MTVEELIRALQNCPEHVRRLPVYFSPTMGVDYPITSGKLYPALVNHETMVDRPERFVLG